MDTLWAPWRMEYILGQDRPEGCIFCPGETTDFDRDRLILHVGRLVMVIMNMYPYNNGHLLVAPNRHVSEPGLLTDRETDRLWRTVNTTIDILKEAMNPDGFNVGLNLGQVAGAGVAAHMHVHIVPRWSGDVNFMTVLAEVRSVPEHIKATFDRLRPMFAAAAAEAGKL